MRVWLYGRLSNDDDVMMNSLENQLEIVREYARKQGYQIVGVSYDDNVSGMRFDRKGLNQVTQAVDAGKIDAVIVKDLSRLGRHQMQTALFIDYLRQCGVAVISVTEGLNTMNDGDDLIIGVRQLMNDSMPGTLEIRSATVTGRNKKKGWLSNRPSATGKIGTPAASGSTRKHR